MKGVSGLSRKTLWVLLGVLSIQTSAFASKITGTDILNLLVDNAVISKEAAQELATEVQGRANTAPEDDGIDGLQILDLLLEQGVIDQASYDQLLARIDKRAAAEAEAEESGESDMSDPIRVPYIPDYVRQEMHESLKFSVEADVVDKVKEEAVRTARVYGWGIKEAPSWVHKLKISGDGRVRYQGDFYPDDNTPAGKPDINDTNDSGEPQFDNITDDRHRLRARFRLMFEAKPFERIKLGMRFVTGNQGNPVSSNQTLGNFGSKWDTNMDLGYIRYDALTKDYMLIGGRFKNPFLHTDLVFDSDMTFEGLAATYYFMRDDSIYGDSSQWDPYFTAGIFPLQDIHVSTFGQTDLGSEIISTNNDRDKYLYAAQLGTDYNFFNTNQLSMGLAYYWYENVQANANPAGLDVNDVTASDFYQLGNSIYRIQDPLDPNNEQLGLASKFRLLNATVKYTIANFYPSYLFLHADYVKNTGFDVDEVRSLTGLNVPVQDSGYQLGVSVGTQKVKYLRDWRVSFMYRHLEGDAVLDAFADSDFLGGGTDSEGYILQFQYGVLDNTIASIKWLSADSINSDPVSDRSVSIDTLQLDISAKF